jgi:integrase
VGIYKRGKVYWYKFMWQGRSVRESTKQGNDKVARQMEAAHRTSLAKGEVGIREKLAVPTLKEFCDTRLEPWAKATFEHTCKNNWFWFRAGIRRLRACESLAKATLDEITNEKVAGFAAHEQGRWQNRGRGQEEDKRGLAVSSVNSSIRVLRRVLNLAVEWGVVESIPALSLLPGEQHRERVVTPDEELRYLAAASTLLGDVATVLADTGMRPDECYRLGWEEITWANGRNGSLLVAHGKTAAARRVLPMTPRVRATLERRWEGAGKPVEGWVWPAPTRSGHIDHSSLKKQHARAFRIANTKAKKDKVAPITPFVLYAFRHTFLTRLGQSGCDAWTLARIAGHSSIAISSRYVHPSEDTVLAAMSRLGGHNSGHSPETLKSPQIAECPDVVEVKEEVWCARRDSNSRPIAPEAIALSI